jgi:hypothetical protein
MREAIRFANTPWRHSGAARGSDCRPFPTGAPDPHRACTGCGKTRLACHSEDPQARRDLALS